MLSRKIFLTLAIISIIGTGVYLFLSVTIQSHMFMVREITRGNSMTPSFIASTPLPSLPTPVPSAHLTPMFTPTLFSPPTPTSSLPLATPLPTPTLPSSPEPTIITPLITTATTTPRTLIVQRFALEDYGGSTAVVWALGLEQERLGIYRYRESTGNWEEMSFKRSVDFIRKIPGIRLRMWPFSDGLLILENTSWEGFILLDNPQQKGELPWTARLCGQKEGSIRYLLSDNRDGSFWMITGDTICRCYLYKHGFWRCDSKVEIKCNDSNREACIVTGDWIFPQIEFFVKSSDTLCAYVIDYANGRSSIFASESVLGDWERVSEVLNPPAVQPVGLWCNKKRRQWWLLTFNGGIQSNRNIKRGPIVQNVFFKKADIWLQDDKIVGVALREDGKLFVINDDELESINIPCSPVSDMAVAMKRDVYVLCNGSIYVASNIWNVTNEIKWRVLPNTIDSGTGM